MLEKACLQVRPLDPSGDEYDPRPVIGIRPSVEQYRRMKNVMDAVMAAGALSPIKFRDLPLTRSKSFPAPCRNLASHDETASQDSGLSLLRQHARMSVP